MITLSEHHDENDLPASSGLAMTFGFNLIASTTDVDQPWNFTSPIEPSFVGDLAYHTILHHRREGVDLFPVLFAWTEPSVEDDAYAIRFTSGNNSSSLNDEFFQSPLESCYYPTLFPHNGKRYVVWWNKLQATVLSVKEYQGGGEFGNTNTIDWVVAGGPQDCDLGEINPFVVKTKPTATTFQDELYVLTARFTDDTETVRVSRNATEEISSFWHNSFVDLGRAQGAPPVIESFGDRLYIFYSGTSGSVNNYIRYRVSDDGVSWSEEFALRINAGITGSDLAFLGGGFDTAVLGDHLVVAFVSDVDDGRIIVALYE